MRRLKKTGQKSTRAYRAVSKGDLNKGPEKGGGNQENVLLPKPRERIAVEAGH